MELVTIKFSHYNEKARWALDRFGVSYTERAYLPMIHAPFSLARTRRLRGWDGTSTAATTPVLVTGRSVIADSEEILRYVSGAYGTTETSLYPTPEASALSVRFSGQLGTDTRRVIYHHAIARPDLLRQVTHGVPAWQEQVWLAILPAFTRFITRALRITPASAARSTDRIWSEIAFVNGLLADGRRYLVADRFTAADLSFAAMAAPVVGVQAHEGYGAKLPPVEALPQEYIDLCHALRGTPAGKHALRMFAEERSVNRPARPSVGA